MIAETIEIWKPLLAQLSIEQQKCLLEIICQRQGLFYAHFCQKIGQSADPFWAILERLGKETYSEKITEEIKAIAPDMDDFARDLGATKALDACVILNQTFLFFADPKPEIWETIIELYLNVPEMIAQETQNEAFFKQEKAILEKWIETEPTLITPEISQKLLPAILKKNTDKMNEILCEALGIFDSEK